jgi:quercetin dioxygenase-like cupin family protein
MPEEVQMRTMRTMRTVALAALVVGSTVPGQVIRAQRPGVRRVNLQQHDLAAPGREAIQARIEFDAGAAFGKHWHPGEEIIYVLEGTLEYQVEGRPSVTLKAGEVLFIPARTVHAAKNVGSGNGAELATYVVEKGQPLVVLVE